MAQKNAKGSPTQIREAEGGLETPGESNSPHTTKPVTYTWLWMPHAGHFIAAYNCHFTMNTYVGDYIVSTVGEYVPHEERGRRNFEEIGLDRLYETMVFSAKPETDPEAMCCPYTINVEDQVDFEGYNDAVSAAKGHYKLCHKWSQDKVTDLQPSDSDANSRLAKAQIRAEYKQLLTELPECVDTADDVDMGDLPHTLPDYYNRGVDHCRALIEARIKELE